MCEVDGSGFVSAGPNDPFFTDAPLRGINGTETVQITLTQYTKSAAYLSHGSCFTTYSSPVNLSAPLTFSTIGTDVQYGYDVISAAASAFGKHSSFTSCVVNLNRLNIYEITNAALQATSATSPTSLSNASSNGTLVAQATRTTLHSTSPLNGSPARQTSLSRTTTSGASTSQAIGMAPAPRPDSVDSRKHVAIIAGVVVPVVFLWMVASCILVWRKRRNFVRRLRSRGSAPAAYGLKPELHAEAVTAGKWMSRNHKQGFRCELDSGERPELEGNNRMHVSLVTSPVQELRGIETNREMEA